MSNWILYDDFVDLVRNHHHNGYSGLITGVSNNQHSFQIGFDHGDIVLLNYRIKKGLAALQLITQIERAKISEHANFDIRDTGVDVPATSTILARLTANTLEDTTTTNINDVPALRQDRRTGNRRGLDSNMIKNIKTAAIHHFGPIGAMVCEDHLAHADGDIRAVILKIAQEVGASEEDTRAFFKMVSGG